MTNSEIQANIAKRMTAKANLAIWQEQRDAEGKELQRQSREHEAETGNLRRQVLDSMPDRDAISTAVYAAIDAAVAEAIMANLQSIFGEHLPANTEQLVQRDLRSMYCGFTTRSLGEL